MPPPAEPARVLVHYPGRGELTGGPRSVLMLLEVLHERGIETILLTEDDGALAGAATRLTSAVWVLPLREMQGGGVGKGRSGLGLSLVGAASMVPAGIRLMLTVFGRLGTRGVDVIWTRGSKGVLLMAPVARLLRIKLVWDVDLEFPSLGPYKLLNSVCLRAADVVVTQSSEHAQELFGSFPAHRRAHVASLLPPLPASRAEEILHVRDHVKVRERAGPIILVVGTISPRKNQLVAVKALERTRAAFPTATLHLVGPSRDAGYLANLVEEVERLGLSSAVTFHGWRQDVLELMARADILLVPSLAEGVPHVIREAMMLGLPVVASRVGGIGELIEDGVSGWLVDPLSVEEVGATLESCLADGGSRNRVASAARSFAERELNSAAWSDRYVQAIVGLGGGKMR